MAAPTRVPEVIEVDLAEIAQNPNHARATPASIVRNLNEMQSHISWREKQEKKKGRDAQVAARVARMISTVVHGDGKSACNLQAMVQLFRRFCPHVTAEMLWIVTTCDPEDEEYLYTRLADRVHEVNADNMTQTKFMELAETILEDVSMDVQEKAIQEHVTALGRGSPRGKPPDSIPVHRAQAQVNSETSGPGQVGGTGARPIFGPEPPPGLIEQLRAAESKVRTESK